MKTVAGRPGANIEVIKQRRAVWPPRRRKGRVPYLLVLVLLATVLVLALAAPAFAAWSKIGRDPTGPGDPNWNCSGSWPWQYGGQTWYTWVGAVVDQDPNTPGMQIAIANLKPIELLIYRVPTSTGTYMDCFDYAWNYYHYYTYIPVSLTPRLVTIQTGNVVVESA